MLNRNVRENLGRLARILAPLLLIGGASAARAGTFNLLGYGAANQAVANSTVSEPTDGFSQAYNPALMVFQGETNFSVGIQGALTSFTPVNNVLIDRPDLGGQSNVYGSPDVSTKDTFLFTLGYQTALNHWERPIHFGINIVSPVERVFEIDTPDLFQPQYGMYLSDTQRLVPSLTLAKQISQKFYLGLGANTFLVQGTASRNRLPAGGESTARLATEIRSGVAPMIGILYKHDDNWNVGLNYRGKEDYQSVVDIDTQLQVLGPTDLIFRGRTSVAYDPDMVLLGVSRHDPIDTYSFMAKYERWQDFKSGAIFLTFNTFNGSFSQYVPPMQFSDIISLHAGWEHRFARHPLRFGLAYVPTPVPDQSGETNILDSDKYEVYAGFGWRWDKTEFFDGALKIDAVLFYDYLVPKTIVKTTSNEIGAPGYDIGGSIYGYGMTATREF